MNLHAELIKWVDSYSSDKWVPIDEIDDGELIIVTIGHVVKESGEYVTISSTMHSNARVCCTISIPKCCIKSRKIIRL